MNEDFLTADRTDRHRHLGRGIAHALRRIGRGFARLQMRQFAAPWKRDIRPRHA